MKIAITSEGPSANADVCPRFGRCPYFVLADTEKPDFKVVENTAATQGSGAGVRAAQLLCDEGVEYVLTGECGPNASEALAAAGIQVVPGYGGKVNEAIQQFAAEDSDDERPEDRERSENRPPPESTSVRTAEPPQSRSVRSASGDPGAGRQRGQGRGGLGRGFGPTQERGHGRGIGRTPGRGRGLGRKQGRG